MELKRENNSLNVDEFIELQLKLMDTIKRNEWYLVKSLAMNGISKSSYYKYLNDYKDSAEVRENHALMQTFGEMKALDEPNPIKSAFMLNNAFGYWTENEQRTLAFKEKQLELEKENSKNTVVIMSKEDVEKL